MNTPVPLKPGDMILVSQTKICRGCNQSLPLIRFSKNCREKDGMQCTCKECFKKYRVGYYAKHKAKVDASNKAWHVKNPGKLTEYSKKCQLRQRVEVVKLLGGKCECCGESRYEFLAIDHKNEDGAEEKRKFGKRRTFQLVRKAENPKDRYRILCHNCNQAIYTYGFCPHKHDTTN